MDRHRGRQRAAGTRSNRSDSIRRTWRRNRKVHRHWADRAMRRLELPPLRASQSAGQRMTTALRRWRLRTIRGRLLVGFSATLAALLLCGVLSMLAIQRLYRDMGAAVTSGNKVSTMLFEGYDATLRYVATAEATILDASGERVAQAERLSAAADSLRRALLRSHALDL